MKRSMDLQLFAEGGALAAGEAAAGAGAAQPSEARLRELGVPEERLQLRAKREERRRKGEVAEDAVTAEKAPAAPVGEQVQVNEKPPVLRIGNRSYDIRSHYDGMHRQAAEMAGRYPAFDLQKELDNPTFLRLTGPEIGLPVEDAYMALHHRELTRAIAEQSRRELSNSIRAGSARPAEHGVGGTAPSVVTFDYRNATRSQRDAFKKQIFDAAARGEKIYPAR